jgi:hypothetical protein
MPAFPRPRRPAMSRRDAGRVIVLAVGWFLLAATLLPRPAQAHLVPATATIPVPPTATTAAPTNTPINTPTTAPTVLATDTPISSSATNTPPPGATATATATQRPSSGGNNGGNNGGNGGGVGPQPTRVNLSQPTVGSSDSGAGISDFSPSKLASNGLFFLTTLGCVFGIAGIAALAIGGVSLVSDGWGPLLVVLLLGNRRGRRRFPRKPR